jgi:NhaP-type Na+/H+ or K+/H+ antiporter
LLRFIFATRNINFNELCFITFAGMTRGVVAFALVLNINYVPRLIPSSDGQYDQEQLN